MGNLISEEILLLNNFNYLNIEAKDRVKVGEIVGKVLNNNETFTSLVKKTQQE